ncbi:MAG: HAD hydrolase-like protein [Pseudomonadota bacterium]
MPQDLAGWTVVVDLDGTLVETAPDLHAALNHVLEKDGLAPIRLETIRMMIGDGAKALIRKGLSHNSVPIDEADIDARLWPSFLTYYETNITQHSHAYEGSVRTLDSLIKRGATLAICTNKAQHLAEQVLNELGLASRFATILGGDRTITKKPSGAHILETIALSHGDASRTIMIGDSQTDERAASDAQLPFIMVSFGYGHLSGAPLPHLEKVDRWTDVEEAINRIVH